MQPRPHGSVIDCQPMNQEVTVWFLVGAHAHVAGSMPSVGCAGGSQSMTLSHHWCFYHSLPLPFSLKSILKMYYILQEPVWLSRQGISLQTEGSHMQFWSRAHAWVVGLVLSREPARGSLSVILSHHWYFYLSLPLPSSLKSIKI